MLLLIFAASARRNNDVNKIRIQNSNRRMQRSIEQGMGDTGIALRICAGKL